MEKSKLVEADREAGAQTETPAEVESSPSSLHSRPGERPIQDK